MPVELEAYSRAPRLLNSLENSPAEDLDGAFSARKTAVRVLGGTSARCETMFRGLVGTFARRETMFAIDGGSFYGSFYLNIHKKMGACAQYFKNFLYLCGWYSS